MKKILLTTALLAILAGSNPIHAQSWLRGLGRAAENAAKRAVEKNIERTVEKAVDKSFQAAENATEDAINKSIEESEAKREARREATREQENTQSSRPAAATSQPADAPDKAAARAEIIQAFSARGSGGTPFYPIKKGIVMTYASSTGKGKPDSYTRSTITDVQWQDERNYSVTTSSEILDADKNPMTSAPFTAGAKVENGIVTYDPKTMAGQLTEGMEISGDHFFLPDNIVVGDRLPDYTMTVSIAGMKTVSENTGISVTGRETVTVSGSQIDCYIIESTVATSALGFKSSMTQKVWYGRGIGQVRSESYNKNGKLMSLSELVELEGY